MQTLIQVLRDGAQMLWGNSGFTLLAILTLSGWFVWAACFCGWNRADYPLGGV